MDAADAHTELSDPATPHERLVEVMNDVAPTGDRVALVIDLTDPPTLPRAMLGDLEAIGADADAAVRALADVVAADLHAQAVEATLAAVDAIAEPPLAKGP